MDTKLKHAMLMHLGWNMWSDIPVSAWGNCKTPEQLSTVCAANRVRTDFNVWNRVTERMAKDGYNMIVLDLGEACVYPSHPELSVTGSLTPEAMKQELARLRGLGLEPIPKLNFSAAHDTWLKQYSRMLSTNTYYQVCADVIRDVCEIFDKPAYFHLGYDEETAAHQRPYGFCIVRQGEQWWHDFLFFAEQLSRQCARPWIWSDYCWRHRDEFLARMPREVLQSNWYYGAEFNVSKISDALTRIRIETYEILDKAGFDQIPCASNYGNTVSLANTVAFAKTHLSSERLKGYLMAPWFFPCLDREQKLMEACQQGRAIWM